jgi:putative transposase
MLIPFLSLRWGIKSILKKVHPWLGEVNSQALQMASRNLDTAYKNFFQRKEAGFPRFRKRSERQSFQCPQNCKVDFQKQELYVPKVGLVPCAWRTSMSKAWSGTAGWPNPYVMPRLDSSR